LIGLENLETLLLERNDLTSLPDDLFVRMKKLKVISFSANRLNVISSRLLEPILLNDLIKVSFAHTGTINAYFQPGETKPHVQLVPTMQMLMDRIDKTCVDPRESQPLNQMPHEIGKRLWASKALSDFIITADSVEFKVHKIVLATQSRVFEKMLEEKSLQKNIDGFTAAVVENFLRCLYTGEIKRECNALEMLKIAAVYKVSEIKSHFERIVSKDIKNYDAMEVINVGNFHGSQVLVDAAFEELKRIHPDLKLSDNLKLKNNPGVLQKIIDTKIAYNESIANMKNCK